MSFNLWRDRLTLLLIALLPWQARLILKPGSLLGIPWEQGTIAFFALDGLLVIALTLHLLTVVTTREAFGRGIPLWLKLAALLPLFALVSAFGAGEPAAAWMASARLLEGFLLACLIWVSRVPLASLLKAFVLGTALSAAFGLWQFFTQTSFAVTWLGISAHPPQDAGVSVVENTFGRLLRAYGTLPHPNVLGGYAAAGLLACMALVSQERRQRPALFAAALVLGATLVASSSRSAWIAFVLASATALILARAVRAKEALRRIAPAFLAALGGAACALLFALPMLTTRVSLQGRLETRSISERAASLTRGAEVFERFPSTGVGIGNYLPAAAEIRPVPEDLYSLQPPHFVPLLVGAELGLLGLAALLAFVFAWGVSAFRFLRQAVSSPAAMAGALPLVIAAVAAFDHYPFDLFAGTMLTGVCFGFFLKAGKDCES